VPLSPHTRLGPYEIIAALGAGGMGEVYRARDTRLDRTVAVKILPEHISSRPQARERFEREARAVSSLNHPNICTLHDIGHQDGIDYLVMEYLEGETLAQRLKKGPLAPEQVLQYAIQITEALETAHKHGVIHRDLKPGNIMVTKSGVKLLDFGLAKVRAAEAMAGVTALPTETAPLNAEGTILGTLQYMAPEQLEGRDADARTDIFALGAVIYEMATGRKAFAGKSQASLIFAIMTAEPPPLTTPPSLASAALDHVVRSCLAKDPDARWQTAHDVLVELNWISGGGATAQNILPIDASRLRNRWLGWMAAGCLFAALVVVSLATYLRPAPEEHVMQFDVPLPQTVSYERFFRMSLSPAGQYVAIVSLIVGDIPSGRIWLHSLYSGTTSLLRGSEGAEWVSWSPDSREIAFSTKSALKRASIAGGPPQTVCNRQAVGPIAWNRDGVILFCPGENNPLYKVSANGGEPRALTKLDQSRQETAHMSPYFLPDGRQFIYLAWSDKPENRASYLGSLDSPSVKRIHGGEQPLVFAPSGYVMFIRGTNSDFPYSRDLGSVPIQTSGVLMAQRLDIRKAEMFGDPMVLVESVSQLGSLSASENGILTYVPGFGPMRTQLVWFDRSGKRLGTVGEPADYSNPAISPDQEMVAVGKRDPETGTRDIWVIDLPRGTSSRLTFDPADDLSPTWSPDGARIAFTSNRKGHRQIYVKAASGVGEDQMLVESADDESIEDWSADGQYLVWGSDPTGYEWLFSLKDHKTLPLLQEKYRQDQCRFFPDANQPPRWIAYSSFETGARQIYVRSLTGVLSGSGGKWQISTAGGSEPTWRRDGKELFYLNGNKLMVVEVNGDGESFHAGIPKQLFETRLTPELRRNRYVVSSDGKRFLVNALVEEQERATFRVVLNWPGLLKR
jgi:Tol biopolymer transport system component